MTRFAFALLLCLPALSQDDNPDDPQEPDPGKDALTQLAKKAGREIKWRKELEATLAEAKESGRLVFCYVFDRDQSQRFGNAFKDRFVMAGPLNDIDLVWTINRRFIPLRLYLDKPSCEFIKVPLADGKERNLFLSDVVIPGFLFLDHNGRVVYKFDRIASASTELFFYACHNVLDKNKQFAKPGKELEDVLAEAAANPKDLRTKFRLGCELIKDAEFERARQVFEDVIKQDPKSKDAVDSAARIAGVCRRLRDAKGATEAIALARKLNEDVGAKIEGDLMMEEALLLVKQGKMADALATLGQAIEKFPKSNRLAEMRYMQGALYYVADEEDRAKEIWKDVAKKFADRSWGWKAAAEAAEQGPLTNGWETLEWLPADLLTGDPSSTERKRKPEEYDAVVREGVEYLLRQQKANGRWVNVKGQFSFPESITALAARALYETRDLSGERHDAACTKAKTYFENWMDKKVPGQGMNMWPWIVGAHLYSRLATDAKDEAAKTAYIKELDACVDMLKKCQNKDGCWTYAGADPSTFSTGGALVALWEARQAGADFEDSIIERAFAGMAKLKTDKGTYQYSSITKTDDFDPTDPRGAAGRGAPCYLAEFLWKKCDQAQLERAMDDFIKYRKHLKAVRKATDWHAGKYANAPYFFFYDYWYAAMAMRHLKDEPGTKWSTDIRNDMLEIQEIDGSWLDWHIGGKNYGTAMAVMILKTVGKPQ